MSISIERIERLAAMQVRVIASRQYVGHVRDELNQEARIKAWACSLAWRPDGGASYETYASRPVRLHLLEYLRHWRPTAAAELQEASDEGKDANRIGDRIEERKRRGVVLGEIKVLTKLEADLILAKYYRDQDLCAWAAQRGRSKAWASEIHTRALGKLRQQRVLCSI